MDEAGDRAGDYSSAEDLKNITIKGELLRKLTHICALGIPIIYYFAGAMVIFPILGAALIIAFSVDMVRFFGHQRSKEFVHRVFGIMIRPHEKKDFTGATYILSSSIISILIFDKPIAILAIAYIVIGDTASAIVGRMWGRLRFRNKTLEGSLSFLDSCSLVALIVPGIPIWVKLTGALCAAVVEALTAYIDDNMTVPLISGAIMQFLIK